MEITVWRCSPTPFYITHSTINHGWIWVSNYSMHYVSPITAESYQFHKPQQERRGTQHYRNAVLFHRNHFRLCIHSIIQIL